MGKRRRLNKLISKWIKSDLPDDRSTVLLLGVTKRQSPAPSPLRTRRPFSLPLALGVVSDCSRGTQVRRNSSVLSSISSIRRPPLVCQKSTRHATDNHRLREIPTVTVTAPPINVYPELESSKPPDWEEVTLLGNSEVSDWPSTTSNCSTKPPNWSDCGNSTVHAHSVTSSVLARPCVATLRKNDLSLGWRDLRHKRMDTSVDSIGACSIDMEASVTMPDWSEASSDGTLRSVSIVSTPKDKHHNHQQHLPSYLSLACTVNGYSTTTNYDPIRLARSRDASPNRPQSEHLTGATNHRVYSVSNNLLSPPNLVPLPIHNGNDVAAMTENILRQHRHHEEFYRSTKTMTYISKESHFTSNHIFTSTATAKDSIDGCIDNHAQSMQSKFVKFESSNLEPITNSQSKTIYESTAKKEYSNGKETKSFIQQRVERLYGPGALAQGFFVSKRQKNRLSLSDDQDTLAVPETEKHSKSLTDKLLLDDDDGSSMKSSNSSPALPVLRHLRPEFRAQLPIISPKKVIEATASPLQKSVTVPKIKENATAAVKVNGHSKEQELPPQTIELNDDIEIKRAVQNGTAKAALTIDTDSETKDGHYFLKIIEVQSNRLLALADRTEKELENADEMSDEVVGKIRSAFGKARLLVSQKVQQFKGLCVNNVTQSAGEAFPTTNEDLQGFWDMVMLQVNQVDKLFEEIDKLKNNGWKEIEKEEPSKQNGTAKPRKIISKPKPSAANEEARKQREEQRKKMIEERRKAMKAQQQQQQSNIGKSNSSICSSSIEIFVPAESS